MRISNRNKKKNKILLDNPVAYHGDEVKFLKVLFLLPNCGQTVGQITMLNQCVFSFVGQPREDLQWYTILFTRIKKQKINEKKNTWSQWNILIYVLTAIFADFLYTQYYNIHMRNIVQYITMLHVSILLAVLSFISVVKANCR